MHALQRLNCIPAGMELFPATTDDSWTLIKQEIDNSDYYLVIIAGRYGSIDTTTALSYTEMEFDYAVAAGKPVVAFLHKDPSSLPPDRRDIDPITSAKLQSFRTKLEWKRHVNFWNTKDDLESAVLSSCFKLFISHPAEGWVRARNRNPASQGLQSVSAGADRDEAFRGVRSRAKKRVIIVGIGMSKIAKYAKSGLLEQALFIPIEFLMIDPLSGQDATT
jgi:hypothetical protein